jgi:hypothetical protein
MLPITRREFSLAALTAISAPSLRGAVRGELPFRQIHLDFHTSEEIPDVAADFDGAEFAATLKSARVNSINVFAKCHHGWAYYDTKIGAKHPGLRRDLLGEMVTACRANYIHVLYYYSLVWDVHIARTHPEWRMLDREGKVIGGIPGDAWPWICMNSPYLEHVVRENEEIIAKYEVDGSWFDILKQPVDGCWCRWCREERDKLGLKDNPRDIYRHNKIVAKRVEERLNAVTHKRFPQGLTFYNSRLVVGVRDELPYYSHIEIESLPTGGWGYTHFQQRVRYMRTLGKEMVGMTGRFHKSWGDFGGLKNQAALDFECLNFLANGTKCCVGDQLHPRGRLDKTTYARIGKTYELVEQLEPWCRGAHAVADIGVVSTAIYTPESTQKLTPSDQGFTNMLVESHRQFNVIDLEEDFSKYRVIILPDEIRSSPELFRKLDSFVAAGGGIVASGTSVSSWPGLGIEFTGPAEYKGEYLLARGNAFPGLDEAAYFLYQPGYSVKAQPGTEILATYGHPYFDRSADHFSSHKQTPVERRSEEPVITMKGRVAYIANPFFKSYAMDGVGAYKIVVDDLLKRLLPQPALVAPRLPSTALLTVLEQPAERRTIVHVLYYPMTRRAPDIDIIEEPGLLANQEIRLRLPAAPSSVSLAPQGKAVPFRYENGYAIVLLETLEGHQAICFA